jgi:hypothetical protein
MSSGRERGLALSPLTNVVYSVLAPEYPLSGRYSNLAHVTARERPKYEYGSIVRVEVVR